MKTLASFTSKSQPTVAFNTFGCKLNFAESSSMGLTLESKGFKRVRFDQSADVYVINSCSVTESADRKCRKAIRSALRKSPEAFIAVTGCYAQLQSEEIASIPGVDLVLGAGEKFNLSQYLDNLSKRRSGKIYSCDIESIDQFFPAFSTFERTRAFLKVQDGCDYTCSYCTIPIARGRSRSARIEQTVLEAQDLVKKGVKEIVLSGVNIGDFGAGSGKSFLELLKELAKIEDTRIRISSIEPNLLSDDIVDFMSLSDCIVPHLHLPLQSGANSVLKRMRRRYSSDLYISKVEMVKKALPDACIGVDVIVGFPGESNDEFNETFNFLRDADIAYLHVFNYSERPNTDAVLIPKKVDPAVRFARSKKLRLLSETKRQIFYESSIGKIKSVLLERHNGDYLEGFSDNYIRVAVAGTRDLVGTVQNIKIEAMGERFVRGTFAT